MDDTQISIYCSGCRRKLGEGNGTSYTFRCPNCKSITSLKVGARLPRIAGRVAERHDDEVPNPKLEA